MKRLATSLAAVTLLVILVQSSGAAQTQTLPAETQLLSRLATQPGDVATYLDLAKLYRAQRRFAEAEQMMLRALDFLRQERNAQNLPGAAPPVAQPAVTWQPAPAAPSYSGQAPLRVGGDIKEPRKIKDVKPEYPPEALAARVSGVVILETLIDTDGSVSDAKVLRSVALLDQAAVDAVRQWKFTPTLLNGVPVQVIMTVTVSFNMK